MKEAVRLSLVWISFSSPTVGSFILFTLSCSIFLYILMKLSKGPKGSDYCIKYTFLHITLFSRCFMGSTIYLKDYV